MSDEISTNLEREMAKIVKEYRSLPPKKLIAKDLKNQRQVTRDNQAAASALTTIPLTKGLSTPLHAGAAGYHGARAFKYGVKSSLSEGVIQQRGLERQKPSFLDNVEDKARGIAMGKSGSKAVKDTKVSAWKAFKDAVQK